MNNYKNIIISTILLFILVFTAPDLSLQISKYFNYASIVKKKKNIKINKTPLK